MRAQEADNNAMTNHHAGLPGGTLISLPFTRMLRLIGLAALALLPTAAAWAQESGAAQEFTVPDTNSYLLLGLFVVALILGIWVVRLIVRFRVLHQDEATLEALEGE